MATVSKWTPFEVALDITATGSNVTRKSATQYTVKINASWETYYSGAKTNYGMKASSGGGSVNLNTFGTKSSNGSGSFTGTYSISGNGSATKTVSVTFENYNTDNGNSAIKAVSFNVTVPAWTSYTIKYNANGGSGAPSSQTKWKDQSLVLSSTKPTRTGYTFQGWALTKADADAGTWYYQAGGTCGKNENLTLYAVWKAITYTIKYNANGGSGAPSSQTKTYGQTLTLSSTKPTRTSVDNDGTLTTYTFKGWSTSSNATTVSYQAGSAYTGNASITLYAVWQSTTIVNEYIVSYNTNGGSSISSQVKKKGTTLVLRDNIPTKYGYTFSGWGLSEDTTVVSYSAGANYTNDNDIVLYAIWTPWQHTIIFDANGGNGNVPSNMTKITGVNLIIPDNTLAKPNCIFKCWSTKSDGSNAINYYTGDGYEASYDNKTITLYAIWKEKEIIIYSSGIIYATEFTEDKSLALSGSTFYLNEMIEK